MAFGATEDSGELIVETQPESTKQTADPKFVNVGYGNLVVAQRVIAVISPNSSPTKRLKDDAKENGRLIDATHGRRTRSIVVTDSKHVILSAVGIETISQRFFANKETRSG